MGLGSDSAFLSGALASVVVAVLQLGGGIRDLMTGIGKDLVETEKARVDIERARLEIEKKFPLEVRILEEKVKQLESRIVPLSEDDALLYRGLDNLSGLFNSLKERGK